MEVRMNTELGLKNIQSNGIREEKRTENPAHIPGNDYSNRMLDNLNRESAALKPSQTKDFYKILGSTIDQMA